MSELSVFPKIIRGEIPSHKVYEDQHTLAFLDIRPVVPGHTLVVPKVQVDRLEQLEPTDYQALMDTVRKVMRRLVEVYGQEYRVCVIVEGFEVAHAHVKLLPCRDPSEFSTKPPTEAEPDHAELAETAQKLAF